VKHPKVRKRKGGKGDWKTEEKREEEKRGEMSTQALNQIPSAWKKQKKILT